MKDRACTQSAADDRKPRSAAAASAKPAKPAQARSTRLARWRAIVLILVHVLIAAHITHWLVAGETLTPVEPSEAMAFSQHSIINAGLVFFAAMILLTAVFGRFFCGWACHVVALQDWCRHLMLKIGITPRPLRSRVLMWVPTLAFLYMFIWPLVYRLWIGDDLSVRGTEFVTEHFWATFPGWIVGGLTLLICGFASVYFLGAKGFCTYGCPYGAAFAAVDRIAPMRIRVTDACMQCGQCTAVCSSNVRVHEEVRDYKMVVSPGCMKCQDCVSACPTQALYYGFGPIPLMVQPPKPRSERAPAPIRWREELLLAVVFALSFWILRGLYGAIPFLMSIGAAGVLAYLSLQCWRLWRLPSVERPGLRLKRDGKLLPHGRIFVAACALLLAFLAHSAVLQWRQGEADRQYEALEAARQSLLAAPEQALADSTRLAARAALDAVLAADDWGLFPILGHAARRAWLLSLAGADPTAAIEAALAGDERPFEMLQLRAHRALQSGQGAIAEAAWREVIALRPDLPQPHLALGLHLARRGDYTLAAEVFESGLAAVPDSALLAYNAGLARAMRGQMDAAIAGFETALRIHPEYLEARENLGGALAAVGRYDEAAAMFQQAIAQSPEDPATRVLLARVHLARGDAPAARAEIEAALRLAPEHPEAKAIQASLPD